MTSISRRQLFELVHSSRIITDIELSCHKCIDFVFQFHGVNESDISVDLRQRTTKTIKDFLYRIKYRWTQSKRRMKTFLQNNIVWLDNKLSFPDEVERNCAHCVKGP